MYFAMQGIVSILGMCIPALILCKTEHTHLDDLIHFRSRVSVKRILALLPAGLAVFAERDRSAAAQPAEAPRAAGPDGIDRMMADNRVVALIAPTTSRAWTNDREDDDNAQGSASRLAAVAGYPHLTVPMGFDRGMPVGISFIGGKWDDARILSLGYAFERATQARRPPGAVPH